MYRPFVFAAVFFIWGISAGYFVWNPWAFIFLILLGFTAMFFLRGKRARNVFIGLVIFFTGAFYYNIRAGATAGTIVDYAGKQQTVIGMVNDSPAIESDRVKYDIKAFYIMEADAYKKVSGRILLSVLRDEKNRRVFRYGDVVKFSGKLKLPQEKRNPGVVDYRASLLQKGISTTMFSREIDFIGPYSVNIFIKAAYMLRESISQFYEKNLSPDLSSLLTGIVLGLKGNISPQSLRAFSDSGTLHLLAVSGMNTAIIYGVLQGIFDLFYVPRVFSFFAGSAAVIFYSFMAGLSPSVFRAAVMIAVLALGRLIGRENDTLNSLGFAAVLMLVVNPLSLFSVSFQLSFAATLGIILFYKTFREIFLRFPSFLRDSLAVVISAQMMVWPFAAYYFHRISLIGFISNLFVVPLVSLVLIGGIVSGLVGIILPPLGAVLVKITGLALTFTERAVVISSRAPMAALVVPELSPAIIILYFILIAIVFDIIPTHFTPVPKVKKVSAAALAAMFLLLIIFKNPGFEVTFVDVGQGDCIFVRTENGGTVLIDGGGMPAYYTGDFDVGSAILEPFLYGRGVGSIDMVIFSHFDDDHARGLLTILRDMKVSAVIYGKPSDSSLYKNMLEIAQSKKIKLIQASRGDRFYMGQTVFEVLNPSRDSTAASDNDNSIVLKMTYGGMSFLFTGDLEHEGERQLIDSGLDLGAKVLKAGHHGSATSTSKEFLSEVNPVFAVISAGKENIYGHPTPEVLELLSQKGIKVFRTDLQGAVTFKIHKNNVKIFTSIPGEL